MRDFEMPKFVVNKEYELNNHGEFVLEPLEKGLGVTIGNALRRVMLSLLPGSAIFAVKVDGAAQEFTSLKGVVQDVPEIILNLKELVLKIDAEEEETQKILKIDVVGPKVVTGADIEAPSDVEIVSKDLFICEVAAGGHLDITIQVCKGRGFVLAETNKVVHDMPIGTIPVDSNFSPIKNVSYDVSTTRVGNSSNYDCLKLTVDTNGAISPSDAVSIASKILIAHFMIVENVSSSTERVNLSERADKLEEKEQRKEVLIEELDFSVRAYNCLKREGITTLSELCAHREEDMLKLKNLGKKSFKEIKDKITELGYKFAD